MSHYSDWRMQGGEIEITDIVKLREYLAAQDQEKRPSDLVAIDSSETIVENTEVRIVKEKHWYFYGFDCGDGDTNINHFDPFDHDVLGWLAGISRYLSNKVEFMVLDEDGPRMEGWVALVIAEAGVARAVPLNLEPADGLREARA